MNGVAILVCPFYKKGLCTSPRLGEPRADVYRPGICDGDETAYSRCSLYASGTGSILEFSERPVQVSERLISSIHYLNRRPTSLCPYFKVVEYGGRYVAFCSVLARHLTGYELEPCERHAEQCPLRKYASGEREVS